jgi:hypothetical protein
MDFIGGTAQWRCPNTLLASLRSDVHSLQEKLKGRSKEIAAK